jgi:acetate kinase
MAKPIVLAINSGSSSIKYSVYERLSPSEVKLLISASVSGLTAPPSKFEYTLYNPLAKELESGKAAECGVNNHDEAFKFFLDFLVSGKGRAVQEQVLPLSRISVICHRIVHGGPEPRPLVITEAELSRLDALSDLAPLYAPRRRANET